MKIEIVAAKFGAMHSIRCMPIFNKLPKVSLCPSCKLHHHFWQEIRTINVMKCPSNSSPQADINSNPNPNLKDKLNTDANPKTHTGGSVD